MKPKYKEQLAKCRPALVRGMDVIKVILPMKEAHHFTSKEVDDILKDTRRRERVVMFLDLLEKKKSESYHKFVEILADHYPHLYLAIDDQQDLFDDGLPNDSIHGASHLNDDWSMLQRARAYLIEEVDAGRVVPYLRKKDILSEEEASQIMAESIPERRTETFLDILEVHPPGDFDVFVDAVGESYPHVYLVLTGDHGADDDDDDFY